MECKEVISSRAVVARHVFPPVLGKTQVVLLKVPDMDFVHIEVFELLFLQVIDDLLVVSRTPFLQLGHNSAGIKQNDQQFLPALSGKLPLFRVSLRSFNGHLRQAGGKSKA
jgi:hypothetical protein